jgi:hypothetical protein
MQLAERREAAMRAGFHAGQSVRRI